MKKKISLIIGGLVSLLLIVGAVGATVAYAQEATPTTSPAHQGPGGGPHGNRGLEPNELQAAAKVLGMTTDDLSTELKSGKTLSDLATEKGVDLQTVKDAIQTARNDQMRAQINQAVTDGKMTQDKANWLLEGLDKGYLNGPGFGFGFGFDHSGLPPQNAVTPAAGQ